MADDTHILQLRNDLAELERVHLFLADRQRAHAIPEETVFALMLALDELLTNIISYGYEDDNHHDIGVSFTVRGTDISLMIEDDGKPFNPLSMPEPQLDVPVDERQIGGLGIHFVKNMMSSCEYEFANGKNKLTLVKTYTPSKS